MPNVIEIVVKAKDEAKVVLAETKKESEGLGSAMTKMGMVSGLALAGVAVEAVKMATSYEASTTRLVTSAGESEAGLKTVSKGMLNMAADTSTGANELAKGMYTVESAGYHGAEGLTVLKAAAQGAKAEQADLGTVANAVTDALTDYHLKASDAADVTSKMIIAVSHGKTTFEDFSGSMHNVLPLAAAMHLSLADVTGVLAEMTAHGVSADQGSQNLAQAMRSLLVPTHAMQTEFKALGTSTEEVHQLLGSQGLAATLEFLQQKAKAVSPNLLDQDAAMKKLIGTAPGLQSALMVTGDSYKDTTAAIKDISGATADATGAVKGYAEYQATLKGQIDQLGASFEDLMIKLGDKLIPVIKDVVGWMDKHHTVVVDLLGVVGALGVALGVVAATTKVLTVATSAATFMQKQFILAEDEAAVATETLGAAMGALPFVVVLAGLAAMGNRATNAVPPLIKAGAAVNGLTKEIQDYAAGSASATQLLTGNIDTLMQQSRGLGQPAQGFKDLDTALSQMVTSGNSSAAAAGVKLITDELTKQGVSLGYIHDQVLPKYNAALASAAAQNGALAQSQDSVATGLDTMAGNIASVTGAWSDVKKAAQAYQDELDGLFGRFGDYSNAQAQFTIDMDDAAKKITSGKNAVDLNTVAGANNFQVLEKLSKANMDLADNLFKTTNDSGRATDALRKGAQAIDDMAAKSGFDKQQIADLNTELYGVPSVTSITIDADTGPASAALAALSHQIAGISGAVGRIGKGGNAAMYRATGGEVGGAATGGDRSGLVWVGEQGPELVRLPAGSTVRSNPDSMAALVGTAQAGSGPVQIEWIGPAHDELFTLIKRWIRIRGGTGPNSVQTALGQSW